MTAAERERWRTRLPTYAVCAIAWAALAFRSPDPGGGTRPCCAMADTLSSGGGSGPSTAASVLTVDWVLMLAAMMAPMLAAPIRHVRQRNFARRRGRAVAMFLSAYVAVWMLAGAILAGLQFALSRAIADTATHNVFVAGLAILWQCAPWKQACLNRGHAHAAFPAFGAAADLGALRSGAAHGVWCVGTCWALMLLPEAFPSVHLPAMALVTVWLIGERLERPSLPRWRVRVPLKALNIGLTQIRKVKAVPHEAGR
ncbi:MAG: hypothetical protein JWM41_3730 [Gemmatimonadetes bacterium]|nr:hypothetical protein [Gemmatimonadota bacterium]